MPVGEKGERGALEDEGRVRLRLTDAKHVPLRLDASANLSAPAGATIAWGTAKVTKLATALTRTSNGKGSADA